MRDFSLVLITIGITCVAGCSSKSTVTAGSGGPDSGFVASGGGAAGDLGAGGITSSSGGATVAGGTTSVGGSGAGGSLGIAGSGTGGVGSVGDAGNGGAKARTDGGFVANPGTANVVVCNGTKSCTSSELCCFTPGTTFPPPGTADTFACSSKPCTGGDTTLSCDGQEDCTGKQSCCRVDTGGVLGTGGVVSYTCRDTCASTIVECSGPSNCPADTVCCETVVGLATTATQSACAKTCAGAGSYILCHADKDCPPNAPKCVDSTAMPGFHRCQ